MTHTDVIVIGGGPAGSTVATRLAQRKRSVRLFEKERFPRFHIGESLLPCSIPLFEQLGVLPDLTDGRFLPKYAAEFVSADGATRQRYP
ncbi:MAG TPA: FAD-dependent oxidoreductase, partial [Polyangiaceae bacterium]|nr:FAD-dependent oxidoreductase [Polyangiaceae bacterium]